MNGLSARKALHHANTEVAYWQMRRRGKHPLSLWALVRRWWKRFWFEYRKQPKHWSRYHGMD